jgi:hypothetical protein
MNDFDGDLGRQLSAASGPDPDLSTAHRAISRRVKVVRRRRAVATGSAAVLLLALAGTAFALGVRHDSSTQLRTAEAPSTERPDLHLGDGTTTTRVTTSTSTTVTTTTTVPETTAPSTTAADEPTTVAETPPPPIEPSGESSVPDNGGHTSGGPTTTRPSVPRTSVPKTSVPPTGTTVVTTTAPTPATTAPVTTQPPTTTGPEPTEPDGNSTTIADLAPRPFEHDGTTIWVGIHDGELRLVDVQLADGWTEKDRRVTHDRVRVRFLTASDVDVTYQVELVGDHLTFSFVVNS